MQSHPHALGRLRWCAGALVAALLAAITPIVVGSQAPRPTIPAPPGAPTSAQSAAEAMTGRRLSNLELSEAIRASGLTAAQVRERLARAGFDPALADSFFAADSASPAFLSSFASAASASALSEIGVLGGESSGDSTLGAEEERSAHESRIFGKDLFGGRSLFDPVVAGPVDPSYRLGVGDQLQVILTGDVEAAFQQLDVRRDGTILLPQVGQVVVAGLTVEAARTLLARRAASLYSGIASGRTRLDLSLGRIRSIQVYVIGEVERPGALQLNALTTVFGALARAGGPTARGTFRHIEVRRGNRVVERVDLYRYLTSGDAVGDVRLEQGDIVFVRVGTRMVSLNGAVRRPGRFELLDGEGARDLVRLAGGFLPEASLTSIQIDRILAPQDRAPGRERVVRDVELDSAMSALDTLHLQDSDLLTVRSVGPLRRDLIAVSGEVNVPGTFQFRPGMTLEDVLDRAEGTLPWALTDRVKIFRLVPQTGRREILNADLSEQAQRRSALAEFDSVVVLDGRLLHPSGVVRVHGAVHLPGAQPFAIGQSLKDVLDRAGGLREEAAAAEIAREVRRSEYTDTSAIILHVSLDSANLEAAERFLIERGDVVSVRAKPGYRVPEAVTVSGEFRIPGIYVLGSDLERISQIVHRAGGLLPTAAPEAFQLVREGRTVAIDLARAMRGDAKEDLVLRPGDELRITRQRNTVSVNGAVRREVIVPFDPRWDVADYIAAAGGYAENADRRAVIVEYVSGQVDRRRRFLGIGVHEPDVQPGANVSVAAREPKTTTLRDNLGTFAQVASTVVSLVVAWSIVNGK
jgi:polysaccharide export outer membrane protein